jgi:hypothetical protein
MLRRSAAEPRFFALASPPFPRHGTGDSAAEESRAMSKDRPQELRDIVERIGQRPANPITRARQMVEQEVPVARRGPGWDRHWRELEAYLEVGVVWRDPAKIAHVDPAGPEDEAPQDKKRADPKTSP